MAQALEYDFIETPSEDFYCPVTLEILTEPHQTLCCGNHLSQEVADRLKGARKPCPICKKANLNTMPDKFFKRLVNQLKVQCSKKALGCNWVGELGDLEKHSREGSVDGGCQYIAVICPLCGDHIQCHQLARHKSTDCPQRPHTCEYCGHKDTYKSVTEDHWPRCERYPLQCPNMCTEKAFERQHLKEHVEDCFQRPYTCKYCGHKDTYKSVTEDHWPRCEKYLLPCPNMCREKAFERQHLKEHVDETCPLHVIQCEYAYAGCKAELKRQLMPAHLDGNVKSHLLMVSEKVPELRCKVEQQRKQIEALTSHIQALVPAIKPEALISLAAPSPVFIPPSDIVMTGFEQHKKDDESWFSPPFYSHVGGYKFCINVEANGWKAGKGTHVGVSIHMMRGEYDDNLNWPFKGEVRVQLLNQRGDKRHIEKALLELSLYLRDDFDESVVGRVVGLERALRGRGYAKFIAHSDLGYNLAKGCQYLRNDCLKFRVTKIELTHK